MLPDDSDQSIIFFQAKGFQPETNMEAKSETFIKRAYFDINNFEDSSKKLDKGSTPLFHHNDTLQGEKRITTEDDLNYYANTLSDEDNFVANLDTILIPRTVGSANREKVREYLAKTMSNFDWDVEIHSFLANTPHVH